MITQIEDLILPLEDSFFRSKLSTEDIRKYFGAEKEEKKVLLVEDDVSQIDLIEELINQINPDTSVDSFLSAEEALAALENNKKLKNERDYDVIIADVFLKGLTNGLDLWTYCKKYYPKALVVVISSFDEKTLNQVFAGEFRDINYIQKPISFKRFREEIGNVIRQK